MIYGYLLSVDALIVLLLTFVVKVVIPLTTVYLMIVFEASGTIEVTRVAVSTELAQDSNMFLDLPIGKIAFSIMSSALLFAQTSIGYRVSVMSDKLLSNIKNKFKKDSLEKYNSLSIESKFKSPQETFTSLQKGIENSFDTIYMTFFAAMDIIGNVFSIFFAMYMSSLLVQIIIATVVFSVVYYNKVFKHISAALGSRSDTRKELNFEKNKLLNMFTGLMYWKKHISELFETQDKISETELNMDLEMTQKAQGITHALLVFRVLLILTCSEKYKLISQYADKFENSAYNINRKLVELYRMKESIKLYKDFWIELTFDKYTPQVELTNKLYIQKATIKVGEIGVVYLKDTISWFKGQIILITGNSGTGKTQFASALVGRSPGVTYKMCDKTYTASSFTDSATAFIQGLSASYVKVGYTLRYYFCKHEGNHDADMLRCLRYFFKPSELKQLFSSCDKLLDMKLKFDPSGGQKSRIMLASVCFDIEVLGRRMVILDEIASDVKYDNQIEIIRHMLSYSVSHGCRIVLISHLSPEVLKQFNIKTHLVQEENCFKLK